jgi:hypothetical protein
MQAHFIVREAKADDRTKDREQAIAAAVELTETTGTEVIVYMAVALVRPVRPRK